MAASTFQEKKYEVSWGDDDKAMCMCVASSHVFREYYFSQPYFLHRHFCDKCFCSTFTHHFTLLVHHFGLKMHLSKVKNFSVVLWGTIWYIFFPVEDAGGKCLPCAVDIQDEEAVYNAVGEAVKKFGGIDILVNNASVINLTGTLETTMKK